jgi:hypothetical protein
MTIEGSAGEWVAAGDWDAYVESLWKAKPKELLSQGLEQAKIASENRKLAYAAEHAMKTADHNRYSGIARDAEARRDTILAIVQTKAVRRSGHQQLWTNVGLVLGTWALVIVTVIVAVNQ